MNIRDNIDSSWFDRTGSTGCGGPARQGFWSRSELRRASFRFWLLSLRQRAACALFGHEEWATISGEWHCMRCSRAGQRQAFVSSTRGDRRRVAGQAADHRAA
jgi:hypothetical protein